MVSVELIEKHKKPKSQQVSELRSFFSEPQTSSEKLDAAEYALQRLISEKHFPAIKFFLETKGRDRGYGMQLEVTQHTSQVEIMNALKIKYSKKE